MTTYYTHGVNLSQGQRQKLAEAYKNKSAITIRLANNELMGSDELMLTKTQINKLKKAMNRGTGSDIKISKTQIRKAVVRGGSLWSSLMSAVPFVLPLAKNVGTKVIAPLATGAIQALGSLGIDKIFGKGVQQGGFLIPQNKIEQLIKYKHLLSAGQKKQILEALQTGGRLVIRPTRTQRGGLLGTLLASLGVPLLLNALTGKGLHVSKKGGRGLSVSPRPRALMPYNPPPFVGSWNNPVGNGLKKKENKKKGKRVTSWEKQPIQQHSAFRSNF